MKKRLYRYSLTVPLSAYQIALFIDAGFLKAWPFEWTDMGWEKMR